jgi:hypothetical protein
MQIRQHSYLNWFSTYLYFKFKKDLQWVFCVRVTWNVDFLVPHHQFVAAIQVGYREGCHENECDANLEFGICAEQFDGPESE